MEDNINTYEPTVIVESPVELSETLEQIIKASQEGDIAGVQRGLEDIKSYTHVNRKINNAYDPEYVPTEYMKYEEVNTAYLHALNTCRSTSEDCFNQVIIAHGVTKDYVDKVKDNNTFASEGVVKDNIKHPSIAKLRKNKTLDIKSLKISSTPNQLIERITKRKNVSDRLDRLELQVELLNDKVSQLEASNEITSNEIRDLSSSIFGEEITKSKEIDKCILLRDKGYKIKQISDILGISESTVKRNLKHTNNK